VQADLRVVKDEEYPFALNYFTGSKEHNIIMRQRALTRGWTLNEYRLGPLEKVEAPQLPRRFQRFAKRLTFIAHSGLITSNRSCARIAENSSPLKCTRCRG
jgi:hypothetical protein